MIPRRPKIPKESMKTVVLTPSAPAKSTTTRENHLSETRGSFYFPGCRKDANCDCEICIASINATLDLMPPSIHGSPHTKFSTSRPLISRSPVSFAPYPDLTTPKSSAKIRTQSLSPPVNSTASPSFEEKVKSRRDLCYRVIEVRLLFGLILVFGLEYGFSWMASAFVKTRLSPDVVKNLGERSWELDGLNARFRFLKSGLEGLVGKNVSSGSCSDESVWKISQDGFLINSRCVLYESMAEEVSIWGWPLQTAGLLTEKYSSRSLGIISGRVTQWTGREATSVVRKANSSWTQGKWSSCLVQLDSNTWILEYRRGFLPDNSRLVSAALEFLKFRLTMELEKMKQGLWLPYAFESRRHPVFVAGGRSIAIPT